MLCWFSYVLLNGFTVGVGWWFTGVYCWFVLVCWFWFFGLLIVLFSFYLFAGTIFDWFIVTCLLCLCLFSVFSGLLLLWCFLASGLLLVLLFMFALIVWCGWIVGFCCVLVMLVIMFVSFYFGWVCVCGGFECSVACIWIGLDLVLMLI